MCHFKMRISESQKDKFKKAFECNCKSITLRLMFSDLRGEDAIAITISQLDRLVEAYEEKKGMTIKMSNTQLAHNMKIEGGFLPTFAKLIPFLTGTVLPALGVTLYHDWRVRSTKTNWKWVVSQEGKWRVG